jgi:hypothetical protein
MASAAAVAVEQSKVRKAERRNILTIRYFAFFFFQSTKRPSCEKRAGGVDGFFFQLCRTPTIAFCHVSEFFFSFFLLLPYPYRR